MSDDWILRRRGEVLTAEVDGETVMLDPSRGSYFVLGSVGSRVWGLLESPISVNHLCGRLCREFDVDPQTCRSDTEEFVDQLLGADLVEVER